MYVERVFADRVRLHVEDVQRPFCAEGGSIQNMRLVHYLDRLNWTQTRLAKEAKISVSTVSRVLQKKTISRKNADKICKTLTKALQQPITPHDVDDIHVPAFEQPERRKQRDTPPPG